MRAGRRGHSTVTVPIECPRNRSIVVRSKSLLMKGQHMRLVNSSAIAVALAMLIPPVIGAQGQETARAVPGGGVSVPGWTGKIDANEEKNGQTLNNAKLAGDAKSLSVTTGPAVAYWNPKNVASGDYTVKATFN